MLYRVRKIIKDWLFKQPPPEVFEESTQAEVQHLMSLLKPWKMTNQGKIRLGNKHDGGYVLPEIAAKSNLVLSIGIANEISFDTDCSKHGAKIYQFDHTIRQPPVGMDANMKYFKKGWGAVATEDLMTFDQMVATADWNGARHPMLKFDVEGAEWECLKATPVELLAKFEIITAEFHSLHTANRKENCEKMTAAFEKLYANHRVIHFHVNNYGSLQLAQGIPVPVVIELTYLRKDCGVADEYSTEPIPGPLDRPNNAQKPDVFIQTF